MTDQTYAPNGARPDATQPVDLEARLAQLDRASARLDDLEPEELAERGARIPFGEKRHQAVDPVVAAIMLTSLRQRDARLFGELLSEAMTGEMIDLHDTPKRSRRRPADA